MKWIMLVSIEMIGIYLLLEGLKKRKMVVSEKTVVKDLFLTRSIKKTPGMVLIIEGVFGVTLGFILFLI